MAASTSVTETQNWESSLYLSLATMRDAVAELSGVWTPPAADAQPTAEEGWWGELAPGPERINEARAKVVKHLLALQERAKQVDNWRVLLEERSRVLEWWGRLCAVVGELQQVPADRSNEFAARQHCGRALQALRETVIYALGRDGIDYRQLEGEGKAHLWGFPDLPTCTVAEPPTQPAPLATPSSFNTPPRGANPTTPPSGPLAKQRRRIIGFGWSNKEGDE